MRKEDTSHFYIMFLFVWPILNFARKRVRSCNITAEKRDSVIRGLRTVRKYGIVEYWNNGIMGKKN
jgi:hypothetical protein